MIREDAVGLLVRCAIGVVVALALCAVLLLIDVRLHPVLPILLALISAVVLWGLRTGVDRAEASALRPVELEPDWASPDAGDITVRRLEERIASAQPAHRITARALARTLADLDDDNPRHDLSAPLAHLLAEAREEDRDAHPIAPISRPDLHRYLRELAAQSEEDHR